jgi:ribose-phosphate pyrophosphokinase
VSGPLLIAMPGNEGLADGLARALGGETGRLVTRHFPDGETYLCLETTLAGRSVALTCTLAHPDDKVLPLLFAASAARDLGASRIGLIAPYLAYMRQDRRFRAGEAITSNYFGRILSHHFDWLVTVDPHLHRHTALGEVFSIPTRVAHAAPVISAWIRRELQKPLLIGPDAESEQWVMAVARDAAAPHVTAQKVRRGDLDVEVSIPDLAVWRDHTPVLVDDIISSGRTMIEAVGQVRRAGMPPPVCIGVHGIFAGQAFDELMAAGAARVITVNTIPHPTNAIDITPLLGEAVGSIAAG